MKDIEKPYVRKYKTFEDDFVESKNQNSKPPKGYRRIHESFFYRAASAFLFALAWLFGIIYTKLVLRVRIVNRGVLKGYRKTGYYLYGNHTQPMGDAFIPTAVLGFKRFHTVAGPANLGIPVIGKLLPMIAAIITPDGIHDFGDFRGALKKRICDGRCVIIYPEAHVWQWYTKIRPFPSSSFYFPAADNVPCFSLTLTYTRKKRGRDGSKPKITAYVDGPFYPDMTLSVRKRQEKLCLTVREAMIKRAENSDYEYIRYEPWDEVSDL